MEEHWHLYVKAVRQRSPTREPGFRRVRCGEGKLRVAAAEPSLGLRHGKILSGRKIVRLKNNGSAPMVGARAIRPVDSPGIPVDFVRLVRVEGMK